MGVDIADQINYDPAAYEASVGATALELPDHGQPDLRKSLSRTPVRTTRKERK